MKHFIIYYKNGTGTYVVTEPRPWARENQHHFPGYDFINTHPNVDTIESYLIDNFGFVQTEYNGQGVSVLINTDPAVAL